MAILHLRHGRSLLLFLLALLYSAAIMQFVAASSPSAASASAKKSSASSSYTRCHNKQNNEQTVETILTTRCGSSTPNKKYTAAAASAMKTINSITSKTQRQPSLPNLSSESALMDKETNVIYWQGGSGIISTSLTKPYLTEKGVLHVKATILSGILWLWIWGKVSRYVVSTYFESSSNNVADSSTLLGQHQLFTMAFTHPLMQKVAAFLAPIIQFILLLIHSLLYLRLPSYSPKFLVTTILLYLIEAFSCSTRRYLSHALNAPTEVEAYLEKMRIAKPVVKWKVRCFHYEDRLRGLKELGKRVDDVNDKLYNALDSSSSSSSSKSFGDTPPLWMAKKVVTHEAVGTYKFDNCEDKTVASLWKRSQSFSSTPHGAPFSKLALSKLLVLKDRRARENYFAQQAAFVTLEGRKDVYAEFATSIEVEGFRPKLLAVLPVRRASHVSAVLFRQHIYVLFTLLGLSLPYRIWFGKHCDEVKVTILKETGSGSVVKTEEAESVEKSSSWFRWGKGTSASTSGGLDSQRAQEQFRKNMQSFSLYGEEGAPSTVVTPATFVTEEDPQRDETPSVDASQDNSELQVTRDKLQIMQNVTGNVADEVAGDVIDEPITQQDQEAITTVDDASMNYDVANPTVNSTITTSPNTSILSDENNSVGNNVDDGRR
mmetsp:Transcript_17584/g.29712  ORF Transcript_17584/g.29712 Transcript_17584/m.29712 type:complete len:659 (-) Transcript_17584:137-2113(-)